MEARSSEKAVRGVILGIEGRVWGSLADKTLAKMSKIKLKNQSQHIFSDFAMLDYGKQADKVSKIVAISEKKDTLKETLIVGGSKNVALSNRAIKSPIVQVMQPLQPSRTKKPASSLGQLPQSKKTEVVNLKIQRDMGNQQAIAEQLRAAKDENQRYTRQLHEKQQKKRAESELHTHLQRKRFKEMKSFTYDYEGKLLSLPPDRNVRPAIHVIAVKPFFGSHTRAQRQNYPSSKVQAPTEIINKKNLSIRPMTAATADPEKQKQQRGSRHTRIRSESSAATELFNYFKESSRVATGVTITDLSSKTRFQGAPLSQSNGNSRLLQFRSDFKHSSNLKQRLKLKRKQHQALSVRTQYDGQNNRNQRVATEGHKDSKIFSVTATSKSRGWIDVRHQPLYTQHFIQDL